MYDFIIPRFFRRLFAKSLSLPTERDAYGASGEEAVYRKLSETFDCVIRNPVVPGKKGYLEKDFMVIHGGVPVVVEVKKWKGRISASSSGDTFFQDKFDGTHKDLNSPVVSTKKFLVGMRSYYQLRSLPLGVVVFVDPDCELDLPFQMDGVALVEGSKMIATIQRLLKKEEPPRHPLNPARVLRCARLYAKNGASFCKGVIADPNIRCFTTKGQRVSLNPVFLQYISVDHQPWRLRDRLTVTFVNQSSATFYNHATSLTFHCLDGSVIRIPISKLTTIVF